MEGQVTLHLGRVRGGGRQSFRVKLGPGDWFGWESLVKVSVMIFLFFLTEQKKSGHSVPRD
jgi:hypothetical protein